MMNNFFKSKKLIALAFIIISVIFYSLVCYFIGIPMLSYVSEPEIFRSNVENKGILGYLLYLFLLIFQIIFAFIPGEPFEMIAGYTFGAFKGTLLCLIGSAIGSTIVFFIARKLGTKVVEIFFSDEKINSVSFLKDKRKMYYLFFFVFFIPGTPKDLLSYVAGLTPIKYLPYLIITTVAKIPSIITSTIGGDAFGDKKYVFAIINFVITAIISLLGLFIYNKITKNKS
jgi:uncharacterized membrane protein YdjX (TVP38/TMEM64 family)